MITGQELLEWFAYDDDAFVEDRSAGKNASYVRIDGWFDLDILAKHIEQLRSLKDVGDENK